MRRDDNKPAPPTEAERLQLTPLHRVTIEHLERSRSETVPVSLFSRVDAGPLVELHERLKQTGASGATLTVIMAKLLADSLTRHPQVNASLSDDAIVRYTTVNLGVAIAVGEHLVVPVIREAQNKNYTVIARELRELRKRAEARKLALSEVRGGTFTLSSIGMLLPDVLGTPVIPPGHAGILLVGGVYEAPVIRSGQVTSGRLLPMSLTVDHRIVNGAAVSTFFADLLERVRHVDLGSSAGSTPEDAQVRRDADG